MTIPFSAHPNIRTVDKTTAVAAGFCAKKSEWLGSTVQSVENRA